MCYEQLAASWPEAVQSQKHVDYADPMSVKTCNRATDQYRALARQIDDTCQAQIGSFADFLLAQEPDVRAARAFCLLEEMH